MAELGSGYSVYAADAQRSASKWGIPLSILQAVIQQESGWNPNVPDNKNTNGTYDHGIAQLNSKYFPDAATLTPSQQIDAAAQHLADKYAQTGTWAAAVKGYNGSGPKAEAYSTEVMALANQLGSTQNPSLGNPFLDTLSAFGLSGLGNSTGDMFASTVDQNAIRETETAAAGAAKDKIAAFFSEMGISAVLIVIAGAIIIFSIGGMFTGAIPNITVKGKL